MAAAQDGNDVVDPDSWSESEISAHMRAHVHSQAPLHFSYLSALLETPQRGL